MNAPRKDPRVLLIDDDPDFCTVMKALAEEINIELDCYSSFEEIGGIEKLEGYALALFDYDLGSENGLELAEYVDFFCQNVPVIIVSGVSNLRKTCRLWPDSVRSFVSKKDGIYPILQVITDYVCPDSFHYQ